MPNPSVLNGRSSDTTDKIVLEDTERRAISMYADDGGAPDAWHAVDHQVRHFYRLLATKKAVRP